MRFPLLFFLALLSSGAFGQNPAITNRTYYEYLDGRRALASGAAGLGGHLKGQQLTTEWLGKAEATAVLVEELKKAGHEYVVTNWLYRLDSAQYVVLAVAASEANLGFLYAEGHNAFPSAASRRPRQAFYPPGRYDYVQTAGTAAGPREHIRIRQLPAQVQVLAEDWYWYQHTEDPGDDRLLVTKADILRVLRQDIAEKVAAAPKRKSP